MRKSRWWGMFFRRRIPAIVVEDCRRAVRALIDAEPKISEIWLFGSYARGTFTEESDIDIAAFVHSPEYYYEVIDLTHLSYGAIWRLVKKESTAVEQLRSAIKGKVALEQKHSIHIITESDAPYFAHQLRGGIQGLIHEIKKGRLLYSKGKVLTF